MKNASHGGDIGKYKILLNTVPSTQDYALELLKSGSANHGMMISCLSQTHGKGRMDKEWVSQKNQNFTASFILKDFAQSKAIQGSHISMIASIAVVETLKLFLQANAMIKWPNDIIYKSKKLAGILITNQWRGTQLESSVLGIGINVNQLDFENAPQAGSLFLFLRKEFLLDDISNALIDRLNHWYLFIKENNFALIQEAYHQHLFGVHETIQVVVHKNNSIEEARVIQIQDDGKIKLEFKNQSSGIYDLDEIKILF